MEFFMPDAIGKTPADNAGEGGIMHGFFNVP